MNLQLGNAYKLIGMLLAEGALEILSALRKSGSLHFKDLRKLSNERTGRNFSANTISTRLKELEQLDAIVRIVSVTSSGRNTVAYKITGPGLKTLEISQRFEDELSKVLHKRRI